VKWRAVDGKLLLNLGKKAVYSSYTHTRQCFLQFGCFFNPYKSNFYPDNIRKHIGYIFFIHDIRRLK